MPGKRKSYKKSHAKPHHMKHNKKRVSKKKVKRGGKLNAFFKLMLDAKKKDLSEFTYNGNTYKQVTAKTGLKLYKKA
tara:strand:- start:63 stop:293 length:231 start_codon:yes stop_codon:yes gene_type:complete